MSRGPWPYLVLFGEVQVRDLVVVDYAGLGFTFADDTSNCRHKDSVSGRHVPEREGSEVYPRDPNGSMLLFVYLDP